MEDPTATPSDETWAEQIAQTLGRQRNQVREFLATQRQCLDQSRAELANHFQQLSESLDRDRAETARAQDEIESRRDHVEKRLEALEQLKNDLDARQARWEDTHREAMGQYEALAQQIERRQEAQVAALSERLAETEKRLEDANDRLSEAQRRLAESPPAADRGADDDWSRRYELAMDDVRELKAQNQDLQQKLAGAQAASPQAASPRAAAGSAGGLDWEAEKRRILAMLESDAEEDNPEAQARRLELQEVVARTGGIVAEKDREINELKQLLEAQSTSHDEVAVGAAALGEILDNDAVVQEEREKLARLQKEWEDKLREAELEVSVERAKLSRERTELEERLRVLEERTAETRDAASQDATQPKRGRWLARLGLKDL